MKEKHTHLLLIILIVILIRLSMFKRKVRHNGAVHLDAVSTVL